MTKEKYLVQISELREQLHELSQEAMCKHQSVGPEYYELSAKFDKVWNNFRAWCRRHHVEFPYQDAMYC